MKKLCLAAILTLLFSQFLFSKEVKIKWFGHSMWSINTDTQTIIIDPFTGTGLPEIDSLYADIVITSHQHRDHNNFDLIASDCKYLKVTESGYYYHKGVEISTQNSSHGVVNGVDRGNNLISFIEIEDINIMHCGDLGVIPSEILIPTVVDILMVPVGGHFTIDALEAKKLIDLVSPKVVLPMHYRLPASKNDMIADISPFQAIYPQIKKLETDHLIFTKDTLPETQMFYILDYE